MGCDDCRELPAIRAERRGRGAAVLQAPDGDQPAAGGHVPDVNHVLVRLAFVPARHRRGQERAVGARTGSMPSASGWSSMAISWPLAVSQTV